MEENIEIKRILDILKSKKLLIVLILILFTLVGYVYSYKYTVPEYKSTSTLLLIPNETEENKAITSADLTLNSELISTYSKIAKKPRVLNQVINNLGLNMTQKELADSMEVNVVKDTYIIKIAVKSKDVNMAENITKEVANVFLQEIKAIYNLNNIGIVDEAQVPSVPYNINHKKDIIMFGAMGIGVAFMYILAIYVFDNTIKAEEDIERYINVKSLGRIPLNIDKKQEIVDRNNAKSYITECINTIRTNILYMTSVKSAKTILVTSCTSQEGKSWFSANIATSFAETNKKVLLIDADMRKGRANKIFEVSSKNGLSDYLYAMSGNMKADLELAKSYIKETKIANLHILTNGTVPPNPSELLDSDTMKELIKIAKNVYDVVIIDAPPCKLVTDSIILSTVVDSTVLVANSEKTKINDLQEVKKSIEIVGGKVIGAVVNKVKITGQTYKKSYYYGHAKQNEEVEVKEKEVIGVNELIDMAMAKLDETVITEVEPVCELQKEEKAENGEMNVLVEANKYDMTEFNKTQSEYLEKIVDTVANIKVQLNNSEVEKELKNRKNENKIEELITTKMTELQESMKDSKSEEKIEELITTKMMELQENLKDSKSEEKIEELITTKMTELQESMKDNKSEEKIEELITTKMTELQESMKESKSEEKIEELIATKMTELQESLKDVKEVENAIEKINAQKLTVEDVEKIVRQNEVTREDIENIVAQNKVTIADIEEVVMQDKLTAEDVEEIVNQNKLTAEDVEEIVNQNKLTAEDVEEIVNQNKLTAEDIQEIVNQNKLTAEDVQEIVNQNKVKVEDIEAIIKKEMVNINYAEQLNKINEMLGVLRDGYLELSNRIALENTETEKIDNENVIDFKVLKRQRQIKRKEREYSTDDSISFEQLEQTAFCVIPISTAKVSYDATDDYDDMIMAK